MSYRVITDTHNIEAMFIMNGGANFVREMTIEQFQFIAKQIYPGFEG